MTNKFDYYVVDADGKLVTEISGTHEFVYANIQSGQFAILENKPTTLSYWDFALSNWVALPPKPADNYIFNYSSKVWEDFWALEGYLEQALAKAKLDADKATYSGFSYRGRTIQSDLKSQSVIQSIVVEDTIDWITEDNSTLTLSKEGFDELKLQLSLHLQTVRAHYNELKYSLPTYTLDQLKDFIYA